MNIPQLAEDSYKRLGERMGLIFEGQKITNLEILDRGRRLHRAFSDLGIRKEESCVFCMANHPMVYAIFQGVFRTGGTAVPAMFMLAEPELRHVLSDTGAKGIVTDLMNIEKVRKAAEDLHHIEWIAVMGGEDKPEAAPPEYCLETLMEAEPEMELPEIDEEDVALMLYTSGTTGKPKGVMLTHKNLISSAKAAADASELDKREKGQIVISAMPMAHIFGVGVMNGGYLIPERLTDGYGVQMAWFDTERFMQLIQEHKAQLFPAVPTILALILSHPNVDKYDLSSLEEVVCGAAPLPPELAKGFMERYGCKVREIYGATECTGIGSANRISHEYRPGSCGQAYFNTPIKIFDDNDNELPTGETGEVCVTGPCVMKGYKNLPEETAAALRNGWFHTGDMGYLDEDGYLYIVDRKKDMILRGGENIYPAELEAIMYGLEEIAEAAVVGVPDPVYGENVISFVVLKPGVSISEQKIKEFMATKTTKFKVPSKIHFVNELPKTGIGKILRRELREKAADLEE